MNEEDKIVKIDFDAYWGVLREDGEFLAAFKWQDHAYAFAEREKIIANKNTIIQLEHRKNT